jgi:four helix bundle protein
MKMHFMELKVWQRAHEFALRLYELTSKFPPEEKFGLISQIRRAGVSVAVNIAEGSKKSSEVDFARFVNISEGSAGELEALLLIARDLKMVTRDEWTSYFTELDEIQRMLHAFKNVLGSK